MLFLPKPTLPYLGLGRMKPKPLARRPTGLTQRYGCDEPRLKQLPALAVRDPYNYKGQTVLDVCRNPPFDMLLLLAIDEAFLLSDFVGDCSLIREKDRPPETSGLDGGQQVDGGEQISLVLAGKTDHDKG